MESEDRWRALMEKITTLVQSVDKLDNEIFERLRKVELEHALLKQRVYFISAGISGGVGAAIAGAAKLLGG